MGCVGEGIGEGGNGVTELRWYSFGNGRGVGGLKDHCSGTRYTA